MEDTKLVTSRQDENFLPVLDTEAVSLQHGLIKLKKMQERSFSLVNEALYRRRVIETSKINNENSRESDSIADQDRGEEDHKHGGEVPEGAAKEVSETESVGGCDNDKEDYTFLKHRHNVEGGRLAFSVENILAPGRFGVGSDDDADQDHLGEEI